MFRTRVTTALEEIQHLCGCAAEHQLPVGQDGDFVKELLGQQRMVSEGSGCHALLGNPHFLAISPLMSSVLHLYSCVG